MEPGRREAELVERARAGNERAWHDLVAREQQALLAHVRAQIPPRLRRRIAADDVVQDALLVAARRIGGFEVRGEGAFGAWLRRIAELRLSEERRKHLGSERRATQREVSRGGRPDTAAFLGRGATPSQLAIGHEAEDSLRAARDRLAPDHREIIRLVRDEGMALAEAAERMERSYEATKKLFARALAALDDELHGDGGG